MYRGLLGSGKISSILVQLHSSHPFVFSKVEPESGDLSSKPIVYNEDATTVERDIGAGPFDRFDEVSTKKVRKSPKSSDKTKIKKPNSPTEVAKEGQVAKRSNSGS